MGCCGADDPIEPKVVSIKRSTRASVASPKDIIAARGVTKLQALEECYLQWDKGALADLLEALNDDVDAVAATINGWTYDENGSQKTSWKKVKRESLLERAKCSLRPREPPLQEPRLVYDKVMRRLLERNCSANGMLAVTRALGKFKEQLALAREVIEDRKHLRQTGSPGKLASAPGRSSLHAALVRFRARRSTPVNHSKKQREQELAKAAQSRESNIADGMKLLSQVTALASVHVCTLLHLHQDSPHFAGAPLRVLSAFAADGCAAHAARAHGGGRQLPVQSPLP